MKKPLVLALLILVLAGVTALAVTWLVPTAPPPARAPAEPDLPAPPAQDSQATGALVMPPVPVDPAEIDRLAVLDEARARYAALRDAYAAGRPDSISKLRLEPAVADLWPAPGRAELGCRGLVCRVTPVPAPAGWQAALAGHPGVKEVAERVAADPDAATTPAYVLLRPKEAAPAPQARGDEFLKGIEAQVRASPEVLACLADAEPGRPLELTLQIDGTGLTYRMGAGLGPQPSLCVSMALVTIMAAQVPPGTPSGTRVVRIERP